MPERIRGRKARPGWTVTVVPDGTTAEAEAATRRAQRLVAEWIRVGAGAAATVAPDRAAAGAGAVAPDRAAAAAPHRAGAGG